MSAPVKRTAETAARFAAHVAKTRSAGKMDFVVKVGGAFDKPSASRASQLDRTRVGVGPKGPIAHKTEAAFQALAPR